MAAGSACGYQEHFTSLASGQTRLQSSDQPTRAVCLYIAALIANVLICVVTSPRKRLAQLRGASPRRRPVMPRIARQVRHDVVVPQAGCRIDGDLGQRPTETSSGPVTPNRPEVGARDYADVGITLR